MYIYIYIQRIEKELHLQCILTLHWAVDWPCRSDSIFLYSRANLWCMLQWLVDVLWVEWICSLSGEGCTSSRNVGLLIVECGCRTSFGNGADDELCTVCVCVCVMSSVSCHQTGKSLNLSDQLEHLFCRFSTWAVDYLPRQPMMHLPRLAREITGLRVSDVWQRCDAMSTCWPSTTPRSLMWKHCICSHKYHGMVKIASCIDFERYIMREWAGIA